MPTPTPAEVLSNPTASRWIKAALRAALPRDPVVAARDAQILAEVLAERARQLLREADRVMSPRYLHPLVHLLCLAIILLGTLLARCIGGP